MFARKSSTPIRNITIDGLTELQSIVFGESSCSASSGEGREGKLVIMNSPKVEYIEVKSKALDDYSHIKFSNLSSLKSLVIDEYAFEWGEIFELESKEQLI